MNTRPFAIFTKYQGWLSVCLFGRHPSALPARERQTLEIDSGKVMDPGVIT